MRPIVILTIILPFILSFIGARIVYARLQGLGKTSAIIWSVLTFGASFFITLIIALIFSGFHG